MDVFSYFGLGCRNVSKLYIPKGYATEGLFQAFIAYSYFSDHHKYRNNYDYQKSVLIINGIPHLDNGFLLLKEDASINSPVSVLNFEYYDKPDLLPVELARSKDSIQCIISPDGAVPGSIPPGTSQFPELWDYADGKDTMDFLLHIGHD
jgi:hypothetical protein